MSVFSADLGIFIHGYRLLTEVQSQSLLIRSLYLMGTALLVGKSLLKPNCF